MSAEIFQELFRLWIDWRPVFLALPICLAAAGLARATTTTVDEP